MIDMSAANGVLCVDADVEACSVAVPSGDTCSVAVRLGDACSVAARPGEAASMCP